MHLLRAFVLTVILATAAFATDYYASTAGSGSTCSLASPCSLQTGLNFQATMGPGDTLYLRGGTYSGKFTSTLDGGTVRSFTGEWAVIDGEATTTLNGAINASVTSITVVSTAGLVTGETIAIDTELMQVGSVDSSTTLTVTRAWAPSIGGAASHSNGATVRHAGNQLLISSSSTTYRDFEVKNSYTQRDLEPGAISGEGCCGFYAAVRGAGISQTSGSGNNYINLVVHDNLDGFFIGGSTSNTLIHGCLIFNNGGHYFDSGEGREVGSGHGLYLENSSGYSRVYDTISINNFNFSGQFYGVSAAYVGGDHQNSVFANAGSPLGGIINPAIRNFNIIYGPNSIESPTANIVNNHYWQPYAAVGGAGAVIGYGAGIDAATVTGNFFVGGPDAVNVQDVDTMTAFTGNKIYSPSANYILKNNTGIATSWNNNTYYDSGGRTVFAVQGVGTFDFAGWKTQTGFDASSTETSVAMPDTVDVNANTEETGRCNVVIYAPSLPTSINVNLTDCALANGQAYTIKNAFNWGGSNVATGNYNSGSPTISVPLNGAAATVATPTGLGFTPATTCPDLCVLIVLPQTLGTASFTGSIRMQGVTIK